MRNIALVSAVLLTLVGCGEKSLTVKATAYNSTRAQTDGRPTETSCGDKLKPGSRVIAVSRDLIKQGLDCGTEVEISGLDGAYTVADVTAARHEQLIDIYMGRDVKAARAWGVREVDITWRDRGRDREREPKSD